MIDRYLKVLFAAILGAMALLYVIDNIANSAAAFQFFTFVTGTGGKDAYPVHLLPPPPPALIVIAMALVFALEFAAGVLLLSGAWRMWRARHSPGPAFAGAMVFAKAGIGCAVANWWGLFHVVAGAGYQMWQLEAAENPFYSAFLFGAMNMLALIHLNQREASPA